LSILKRQSLRDQSEQPSFDIFRREALLAGSIAFVTPTRWTAPVVASLILPDHAMASTPPTRRSFTLYNASLGRSGGVQTLRTVSILLCGGDESDDHRVSISAGTPTGDVGLGRYVLVPGAHNRILLSSSIDFDSIQTLALSYSSADLSKIIETTNERLSDMIERDGLDFIPCDLVF